MLQDLVINNRSYRRFFQKERLELDLLKKLVNYGRLSASAANLQPLRYILVNHPDTNEQVFKTLRWAGYLRDWEGPEVGEKPSAYLLMLGDREYPKFHQFDGGLAAQSILLGAAEEGFGGCIFASCDRGRLEQELQIPSEYEIIVVIALGRPKERVVIDEISYGEKIEYWRDEKAVHHVPKRKLDDVIIKIYI